MIEHRLNNDAKVKTHKQFRINYNFKRKKIKQFYKCLSENDENELNAY